MCGHCSVSPSCFSMRSLSCFSALSVSWFGFGCFFIAVIVFSIALNCSCNKLGMLDYSPFGFVY